MSRTRASNPGVVVGRLQAALTRRILPVAVALTVAYLAIFELRPNLLSADTAQLSGSTLFPQSGCETARNCHGTLLDRYVYTADAEFGWKDTGNRMQAKELKPLVGILILFLCLAAPALRWKDTGNRMRAKEPGGWWTGYVLLVNTHRWLNRSVTNRFHWWHHLTLIVSMGFRFKLHYIASGWWGIMSFT
ncbi:unnamed protein product [Closterium sp. NIES-54]